MSMHEKGREVAYLFRNAGWNNVEGVYLVIDDEESDGCWEMETFETDLHNRPHKTGKVERVPVKIVPEGRSWPGYMTDTEAQNMWRQFTPVGKDSACK